jgi:hypothetical protein
MIGLTKPTKWLQTIERQTHNPLELPHLLLKEAIAVGDIIKCTFITHL